MELMCPLCGKEVIRGRYKYGCRGYKDGCSFGVSINICNRNISVSNIKLLLETGQTSKICGFVSKLGKSFDGVLKLVDGKAVFDFTRGEQNKAFTEANRITSSFDFK